MWGVVGICVCVCIYIYNYIYIYIYIYMLPFQTENRKMEAQAIFLKGTVARDFLPLGFSTNRPHIVPEFTP
jgi:hypothetical protein